MALARMPWGPGSLPSPNPNAQASDNTRIFIAGALLGLAGGALLSFVQETLTRYVG
jgi:hypothetical protein